jgi:hypothetical protein
MKWRLICKLKKYVADNFMILQEKDLKSIGICWFLLVILGTIVPLKIKNHNHTTFEKQRLIDFHEVSIDGLNRPEIDGSVESGGFKANI